jgi:hypothetical protein
MVRSGGLPLLRGSFVRETTAPRRTNQAASHGRAAVICSAALRRQTIGPAIELSEPGRLADPIYHKAADKDGSGLEPATDGDLCNRACTLAETVRIDVPGGEPMPFRTPAVYRHLSSLPAGAVLLLSLPMYRGSPEDSGRLITSCTRRCIRTRSPTTSVRHQALGHRDNLDALARFPASGAVRAWRSWELVT